MAPGPVVVPGALPGEVVSGAVADAVMAAPRIVTPSPDRVRPPCSHARACGGCAVQHGSDALVARWKRDMVAEALRGHGVEAEVLNPVTSPVASRRRAGFAGRRTKKGALVGFHGRASHTLVEVPECRVVTPALRAVLPVLEALVLAGGSRKGEIAFLCTDTLGGIDVAAKGGKPLDMELRARLAGIGGEGGLARLSWEDEPVAAWQAPLVALGPARVELPAGAFLQATAEGQAALTARVTGAIGEAARVADLFCGCGTFALPLSRTAEVLALESETAQLDAMVQGWRRVPGLKRLDAQRRDLFRRPLAAADLAGIDAVVIDPPRAGAAAQMAELATSDVPRVASVSCNPATFARDAAALIAGGYRMGPVHVIDQFRWSPHVEVFAAFTRA